MSKFFTLTLGFLLFAGADIPGSERLRSPSLLPSARFSPEDAIDVIGGFTVCNDISVRVRAYLDSVMVARLFEQNPIG